jgi:prolyl 4-hydroxylase
MPLQSIVMNPSYVTATMPDIMSMLVNFTPELRAWILHNIDRGCTADDVVDTMVSQKFEPEIAHALVDAFILARRQGIDPPMESVTLDFTDKKSPSETFPDYQYETPRMAAGHVIHTSDRKIPVLLRMEKPFIAVLDSVLSNDECDMLITLSRNRMQRSTVVDLLTGENKIAEHRDSYGMFFQLKETPFIAKLDKRISELMNCPIENGEGLQVLHYGPSAKNTPHFDFLMPSNKTNRESLARSGQRISSLVIYLNDVADGGETIFPEVGLAVTPKKGNAVYFEYANSLHQLDHKSLHAGAAVSTGEKWAVTKWMRERRFIPA